MEITVKIEASALVDAIHSLAAAIAGNIELLLNLPQIAEMGGAAIAPSPVTKLPPAVVETSEPVNEETPTVTLEQVRAKLTALTREGKQAQVKDLVNKYAKKMTEIPPEKYAEVLKAAEAI